LTRSTASPYALRPMSLRSLLLCAALSVVALWPQGLVLCVAPGSHTDVEPSSTPPCDGGSGECEDLGSPEARTPTNPAPVPAAAAPAAGDAPAACGREPDLPRRVIPQHVAPSAPPVLPVLTI
jgi:hypothetical protein